MARKNLFELAPEEEGANGTAVERPLLNTRPLAGLERPVRRTSPVGAISQSLDNMQEKAQRVDEIERKLAEGQSIIELDPSLIDSSFVVDRLGVSDKDQEQLVAQIREQGQQVPILVRPHPLMPGRYQVAYGHRRLAAVRQIGHRVRAVVRQLTDEQLVISQGQENNSRTDLSFIERSFFAFRLEERGFTRDIIMSALGIDKAALSRMIALVHRIPPDIIIAIGAAPGIGRQRWAELADFLDDKSKLAKAVKLTQIESFSDRTSDLRFQSLYEGLRKIKDSPRKTHWKNREGYKTVRISESDDKISLVFDKSVEPGFGTFIEQQLDGLYQDYQRLNSSKETGD